MPSRLALSAAEPSENLQASSQNPPRTLQEPSKNSAQPQARLANERLATEQRHLSIRQHDRQHTEAQADGLFEGASPQGRCLMGDAGVWAPPRWVSEERMEPFGAAGDSRLELRGRRWRGYRAATVALSTGRVVSAPPVSLAITVGPRAAVGCELIDHIVYCRHYEYFGQDGMAGEDTSRGNSSKRAVTCEASQTSTAKPWSKAIKATYGSNRH